MKIDNRVAYTLMELLLVLAILSIISLLAIPNTKFFLNMREQQELNELKKDLLYARNRAIVEGRSYFVYFDRERNQYIIRYSETSPPVKVKEFKHGIKIWKDNSTSILRFNANGRPGESGSIYLVDRKNNRYKLSLTPATGRIELGILDK